MQREYVGFVVLGGLISMVIAVEHSTFVAIECGLGCSKTEPKEPYFMFCGLLLGAFAVVFPQIKPVLKGRRRVELWRRAAAALIDIQVVLGGVMSVTILLQHAALYVIFGSWSWSNSGAGDPTINWIYSVGAVVAFTLIYAYFWLPSKRSRATVGQYIMGFQIVSDSHSPKFGLRPLLSYIAFTSVMFWCWFDSGGAIEGRHWWDRASGTRPIMVTA